MSHGTINYSRYVAHHEPCRGRSCSRDRQSREPPTKSTYWSLEDRYKIAYYIQRVENIRKLAACRRMLDFDSDDSTNETESSSQPSDGTDESEDDSDIVSPVDRHDLDRSIDVNTLPTLTADRHHQHYTTVKSDDQQETEDQYNEDDEVLSVSEVDMLPARRSGQPIERENPIRTYRDLAFVSPRPSTPPPTPSAPSRYLNGRKHSIADSSERSMSPILGRRQRNRARHTRCYRSRWPLQPTPERLFRAVDRITSNNCSRCVYTAAAATDTCQNKPLCRRCDNIPAIASALRDVLCFC